MAYAAKATRFSQWWSGVVDGRITTSGVRKVGDWHRCLTSRRIGGAVCPYDSNDTRSYRCGGGWVQALHGPIRVWWTSSSSFSMMPAHG
ncbi:hypothetical protein ASC58_12565 [Phycicoccus sp. Root101]|nr:hypothetical protein ASC58_12565 [Phycicoccus sp. Root101]